MPLCVSKPLCVPGFPSLSPRCVILSLAPSCLALLCGCYCLSIHMHKVRLEIFNLPNNLTTSFPPIMWQRNTLFYLVWPCVSAATLKTLSWDFIGRPLFIQHIDSLTRSLLSEIRRCYLLRLLKWSRFPCGGLLCIRVCLFAKCIVGPGTAMCAERGRNLS